MSGEKELLAINKALMEQLSDVAHIEGGDSTASLPSVVRFTKTGKNPQTQVPPFCFPDATFCDASEIDKWISQFTTSEHEGAEPTSVEELKAIAENASCGKGTKTITDLNERSTLTCDLNAGIRFAWDGLDDCIRRIETELKPVYRLAPQLHSVLVYRDGDHFRWHFDAKKTERHIITLSVDCTPPTGQPKKKDGRSEPHTVNFRDEHAWKSKGRGSWASWFASEEHEVPEAKGPDCVVAIFNLIATHVRNTSGEDDAEKKEVAIAKELISKELSKQEKDIANLRASFYDYHGKALEANTKTKEQVTKKSVYVGLVLTHQYSFDGKECVPDFNIRGRDRTIMKGLELVLEEQRQNRDANIDVHVQKCFSVIDLALESAPGEDPEQHITIAGKHRFRFGAEFKELGDCGDRYHDDDFYSENPEAPFHPSWRDHFGINSDSRPTKAQELLARDTFPVYLVNGDDCDFWKKHAGEYETDTSERPVPVKAIASALKNYEIFGYPSIGIGNLWGNEQIHKHFVYRSACVVGKMIE